jgi:hypothetical protein
METTERTEVRRALDDLKPYLLAYVAQHGQASKSAARGSQTGRGDDIQALLRSMLNSWDAVFRQHLPSVARSYVHELIDIRNRWAHEEPFSRVEADRAEDTARRLADLIGAPNARVDQAVRAAVSKKAPVRSAPRKSQRDVMQDIYNAHGPDVDRVVREYASAERRGEVDRARNAKAITAEAYARALLSDGERKGWLQTNSEDNGRH